MARPSRTGRGPISQAHMPAFKTVPATVAALGVQVRLVQVDPAWECAFTRLLAEYERLWQEWDRLLLEAIDLLGPEFRLDQLGEGSLPQKMDE